MRYELWEHDGGHTFFEVDSEEAVYLDRIRQLKLEEPDSHHAWTVEAASWDEAMQALYDRKGWGKFRTLDADLSESADSDSHGKL